MYRILRTYCKVSRMKRALIPLLLCIAALGCAAQVPSSWCLTPSGRSEWLIDFQKSASYDFPLRSGSSWNIPVQIFITLGPDGQKAVEIDNMLNAFCKLNTDFNHTGIQFYINRITYLDRPDYYDHADIGAAVSMINAFRQEGVVNVFFVNTAVEEGICGYNVVDQDRHSIGMTLSGSCTNSYNSNWAHEMGHYFSLPHTFNGWEGVVHDYREPAPLFVNNVPVELADGSNCQVAGDGFCDTPADYLNGRWFCAEDGESFPQIDPEGANFRSDGTMIMSYAQDGCSNRFSDRQKSAMQNYLLSRRKDHLENAQQFAAIRSRDIITTYPAMGQDLPPSNRVPFEWDRIDGALGYILEISMIPTFAVLEKREFVFTANHSVTGLRKNRTYYWRVRAFNGRYTCPVYSDVMSFQLSGTTTTTREPENLAKITLGPNPLPSGQSLDVQIVSTTTSNWDLSLHNSSGQEILREQRRLVAGDHTWKLSATRELAPGLYLLRLQNATGLVTRKVVVR